MNARYRSRVVRVIDVTPLADWHRGLRIGVGIFAAVVLGLALIWTAAAVLP